MRTIGFRSTALFIVAAALGLLASLGQPWYARAPAPLIAESGIGGGRARSKASSRASCASSPRTAARRAGTPLPAPMGSSRCSWRSPCSLRSGALFPAIEQPCREILRLVTLAMLGIVVVKLVNTPDDVGLVERRQGAWIALGVTGIMASSASTLYTAPLRRRKSGPSLNEYQPHLVAPRSSAFDTPGQPGERY